MIEIGNIITSKSFVIGEVEEEPTLFSRGHFSVGYKNKKRDSFTKRGELMNQERMQDMFCRRYKKRRCCRGAWV